MTVSARDIDATWKGVEEAQKLLAARLTEFRELVARLNVPADPPRFPCPVPACGIGKPSEAALAEHLRNVHGVEPGS